MLDLVLAIAHHLAILALVGVVAAELVLLRPGIAGAGLERLGRLDAAYGAIAGLVLAAGVLRVFLGAPGAGFYLANPVFWMKIGAFVGVGLLSIAPTISLLRWRREARADADFVPTAAAVRQSRRFLYGEAALLGLIPVFAAAMARGVGL